MKRPALQNERVRVLGTAFRARKVFGTFEERATDPSETVDKYINNEFPDKIAIKLDSIHLEKEDQSEIALTVQLICVLS